MLIMFLVKLHLDYVLNVLLDLNFFIFSAMYCLISAEEMFCMCFLS